MPNSNKNANNKGKKYVSVIIKIKREIVLIRLLSWKPFIHKIIILESAKKNCNWFFDLTMVNI